MADRPQCQHYVCVSSETDSPAAPERQQAMTTDAAISEVLREIGAASLREALLTFLSGRDTLVVLPTGYDGKSLIYATLPLVFGHR